MSTSWRDKRLHTADRLASGLAGWHQFHHASGVGKLAGENAASLAIARIAQSLQSYQVEVSKRPPNWSEHEKKRVDVALKAKSAKAISAWYGAIELKWLVSEFDRAQKRLDVIQDVARLAAVNTQLLNARFLVLGCVGASEDLLFDKVHDRAQDQEEKRAAFEWFLCRDPDKEAAWPRVELAKYFPEFESRCPNNVKKGASGRLVTKLVASAEARCGDDLLGRVFAWQCNMRK